MKCSWKKTMFVALATVSLMCTACGFEESSSIARIQQAGTVSKGGTRKEGASKTADRKGSHYSLGSSITTVEYGRRLDLIDYMAGSPVLNCGEVKDDGVVGSFTLAEIKEGRFRRGSSKCHSMMSSGDIDSRDPSKVKHFFHTGDGTTNTISAGTGRLPVGIRIYEKFPLLENSKIVDVAILQNTPSNILKKEVGYSQTSRLFGRDGDHTKALFCGQGKVLTGIRLATPLCSSEGQVISGIQIECQDLEESK